MLGSVAPIGWRTSVRSNGDMNACRIGATSIGSSRLSLSDLALSDGHEDDRTSGGGVLRFRQPSLCEGDAVAGGLLSLLSLYELEDTDGRVR